MYLYLSLHERTERKILTLDKMVKEKIYDLLVKMVREKQENYSRETFSAPFHERLFGKEIYERFSFIQSLNTSLGISVWEQIAVIIVKNHGGYAERQYRLKGSINENVNMFIRNYLNHLYESQSRPNKYQEILKIRQLAGPGNIKYQNNVVDLYVKLGNREEYIDITSVKPNKKEFQTMKEKLLYWTAMRLSTDKDADVMTRLAMPYNPYEPGPYSRWTDGQLYDLSNGEILVGKEFWNYIGQGEIYDDLLEVFSLAGKTERRSRGLDEF